MKRTIVTLAVMAIAAISVNAQQPEKQGKPEQAQHHRHHGKGGHDRITAKLNFTDAQKQQLKNINSDYHKKMADLKKHDEITVKDFKTQMGALHKEHRAQIQALLTPAQKDQLAQMKKQRMEMAKVNANARVEKMKIKLGLTDAQASQLKDMRSSTMTKIKSIHQDTNLSREQKHEQIKSLVMQQKDQLKTILTPEQLQQLEQMKQQHHRREFSK